jgi:hypothetical protein
MKSAKEIDLKRSFLSVNNQEGLSTIQKVLYSLYTYRKLLGACRAGPWAVHET